MKHLAIRVVSLTKKYGNNFAVNMLQQGMRFLILYIAAKQLGPKEFGIISLVLLVVNYLLNANLGAINGLKRQIPLIYAGKGGDTSLSAFFSVLNFNWIATIFVSVIAAFVMNATYDLNLAACILMVLLSVSTNTYFSVQAYFTSTGNWGNLFRLQLICSLLLIVTLTSLFFSNHIILLASYTISFLLAALLFFYKNGYRFVLNKAVIKENVSIGFPIMISGFVYLIFQTTDRLIVSHYYSKEQFGFYSLAWVLVMSLNLLINLSSEMLLQRAASRYAQIPDKVDLLKYILKHAALLQAVLVIVSMLLLIVIRIAIPMYLSDYEPALPIIYNIVFAYVIQQLALGVANYYYITGQQLTYNLLLAVCCLVNAALLFGYIQQNAILPPLADISGFYILSSCIYVIILYLPLLKKYFYP